MLFTKIILKKKNCVDNEAVFFYINVAFGVIAQLGERLNGIQEVRGSIPLSSTNFFKPSGWDGFLLIGAVAQLGWLSEKTPAGCFRLQHLGCLSKQGKRERLQRA